MPMWMYGYSWPETLPMVFWMVGGALFWIALLAVVTWLYARWSGHILAQLDSATRGLDRARDELLRARDADGASAVRKRAALNAPAAGGAPEGMKRL